MLSLSRPGVDVVRPLAAARLLDHHGNQDHAAPFVVVVVHTSARSRATYLTSTGIPEGSTFAPRNQEVHGPGEAHLVAKRLEAAGLRHLLAQGRGLHAALGRGALELRLELGLGDLDLLALRDRVEQQVLLDPALGPRPRLLAQPGPSPPSRDRRRSPRDTARSRAGPTSFPTRRGPRAPGTSRRDSRASRIDRRNRRRRSASFSRRRRPRTFSRRVSTVSPSETALASSSSSAGRRFSFSAARVTS